MSEKIKMSVSEFDLLIRSMHREWLQQPKCITRSGESTFYEHRVHIFICSLGTIWPSVGGVEYEITRPSGIFNRKDRKIFDETMRLLAEVHNDKSPSSGGAEENICKHIPCAKDIIAEKALIKDHE